MTSSYIKVRPNGVTNGFFSFSFFPLLWTASQIHLRSFNWFCRARIGLLPESTLEGVKTLRSTTSTYQMNRQFHGPSLPTLMHKSNERLLSPRLKHGPRGRFGNCYTITPNYPMVLVIYILLYFQKEKKNQVISESFFFPIINLY